MSKQNNLIWIDLEMSGLNPQTDKILEIATIVTNSELEIIAEGPNIVIHQPPRVLEAMDEWNTKQHNKTGLVTLVENSKVDEEEAEQETLDFLKKYASEGKSPMCGNTVYHDRKFLIHYMPILESYFHYRIVDVSTVKELAKRWIPKLAKEYEKEKEKTSHRALSDIRDSINELKFYRKHFFVEV